MPNEHTPLLWSSYHHLDADNSNFSTDPHAQFCMMVGVPSSAPSPDGKSRASAVPPKSLYGRATHQLANQRFTYYMTASLSNTMLLSQVVLGAALTALGASESSHILITIFGAMNTIIAGLVAYLKSRGQPMRARMYRDDLERVVDEIENSEVMWLGISAGVNGYDDIDTGDGKGGERGAAAVTVRSEVARLTRLYDRAVRNNTVNNPDMYMTGTVDANYAGATLRSRGAVAGGQAAALPIAAPAPAPVAAPAASLNPGPPVPTAAPIQQQAPDPDESPATAPPKPKEDKTTEEQKEEETKGKAKEAKEAKSDGESSNSSDSKAEGKKGKAADEPAQKDQGQERDPDAEPASDPNVPLKKVAGDVADTES
ncbi:uncharacterized protein Z519_10435 [Cladophialophora bantiana CBS 173.52]|uniref:SMODS and SLOG-associating 2TM effector domain-containing protein n=1 Tax=Cladophialophora bantiana (strain ATCC 10958 / CBS 173.52 / CDC B-1940 / NIH 8579) TaxID=1442370 RepID=A0A0D2EFY2_CLAB1|nr:uncharacterized protein Z519_10435 [Cladophialophora bantiana CBS 173.52]KIW88951.1 hypothetical protein Z519_10435 [Cladophialophora bantiana CBS 173.52]